jgi:DnaK suppressor protein
MADAAGAPVPGHGGPTGREREELEERLRGEAEALGERIDSLAAREAALRGDCLLDPADVSSVDEAVERSRTEAEAARDRRDQILTTLRKLADGTFGTCTRCGTRIDEERMAALPHTRLCIDCRRAREAAR